MIELAIFGSLALLALAFLIQIGLRQNFQQEIEQTAFRRALRVAHSENKEIVGSLGWNTIEEESQAISYNYFRNRRLPNPSDGFAVAPRSLTQGSGTVTWGEWLTYLTDDRDSQPRIIVNLDDQQALDARSEDFPKDQPLVRHIHKDLNGAAQIEQWPTETSQASISSETTEVTLSGGETVSSSQDTNISRAWSQPP